jgi:hypothetical protein
MSQGRGSKIGNSRRADSLRLERDRVVRLRLPDHSESFEHEARLYRLGGERGWPIPALLESGPDWFAVERFPYDAQTLPPGFDAVTWSVSVAEFWQSLPFTHNDPAPEHVVFGEDPRDLRAIDLEDAAAGGPAGSNDFWAGMMLVAMCIQHLGAPRILMDYYELREPLDDALEEWDHDLLRMAWEMGQLGGREPSIALGTPLIALRARERQET